MINDNQNELREQFVSFDIRRTMKIIIAGAGEVGTHLAKLLSKENLDIVLIDTDIEKLRWLDLNYNLMTIAGSYFPQNFETGWHKRSRSIHCRHAF